MLADGKQNVSILSLGGPGLSPEGSLSIALQAAQFPLPPAMPDTVLLLRLLLSSHTADLHAITDVIRNDVGLTARLFHLAALERGGRATTILNVGDLVVQVGLEKLKNLAAETKLNPLQPQNAAPQARERFWMHARLTARISEELAGDATPANREAAYVAGLLRHLGALPALLGWEMPSWSPGSLGEIGYGMAKAWQLPLVLADVIRGNDSACTSQKAHSLLRLVNLADERAARWESTGTPMRSAWVWSSHDREPQKDQHGHG
jgi:HD-like signal output (HDOD) protein